MSKQDTVGIGVIGVGGMGGTHSRNIMEGKVPGAELVAVCDLVEASRASFAPVTGYAEAAELLADSAVAAVIVATPHYQHTPLAVQAFEHGKHVLVEKPLGVHKADCERVLAAHAQRPELVFAEMLNQRTDPPYRALKRLLDDGELGEVRRFNWIITDWCRTDAYYASGGWRATWRGEGGGILLNQCPHQLDLMQWLFGMPTAVRAFCHFGKWHDIEVEDAVTAYLELPNGATAVFVASTGEAPGTNRLEVAAERGRVVIEAGDITFTRNEVEMSHFLRTSPERFARPAAAEVDVAVGADSNRHVTIMSNFVAAIRDGEPLIAPGSEGIGSVELANAMIYSTLTDATVTLPLDGAAYAVELQRLIDASARPA